MKIELLGLRANCFSIYYPSRHRHDVIQMSTVRDTNDQMKSRELINLFFSILK